MNLFSKLIAYFIFSFIFFFASLNAIALDLSSTNFIIKDPVVGTGGGYGTSTNFTAFTGGDLVLTGTGTSTNFATLYGFLYFADTTSAAPTISFSISDNAVAFGTLTTGGARYATTTGGSGSNSIAHTMDASSNASAGYAISYKGPTLTSGGNTIAGASITGDADGAPGTAQFGLALSTGGSATIVTAYQQSANNWAFVPNTTTAIASTSGATASETYSVRYLANISPTTAAGSYSTGITYVIVGNY
jgi:hypothetical protein